jgi:hypothetical protein
MTRLRTSGWWSIVLLCIASLGAPAASERGALKSTTPQQRAVVQTDFMKSQLGLSDDQLPEVSRINLEYAQKADPLIKGSEGDLKLLNEMKSLMQSKDDELKGVLNEAQFQKYESLKKEMDNEVLKMAQEQETKAKGSS